MSDLEAWVRRTHALEQGTELLLLQEARARAAKLRLSEAELVRHLDADPAEAQSLLSHAVPPETWLFRHGPAFECLRERITGSAPLRMASLGCASGAEPFSMAAAAASVGRHAGNTRIVALDRNATALQKAAEGRVSPLGQRSPLPSWAGRWFEPLPQGGLRLHPDALAMIEWMHADALAADLGDPFDAVMCRNMAIYLNGAARSRLQQRLVRAVRPGGLLFVGHADPDSIWRGHFRWLDLRGAFSLERAHMGAADTKPRMSSPRRDTAVTNDPAPARHDHGSLEDLRSLADAGDLQTAHRGVVLWVAAHPLQADAWWLRAAIELAQGRFEDAEASLDRVLYLEPMHSMALLQSGELAERRGDRDAAERLRRRARRAMRQEAPE
jgi:chemotaxis protein methyltransferase WspC